MSSFLVRGWWGFIEALITRTVERHSACATKVDDPGYYKNTFICFDYNGMTLQEY
jgi:hypothetical protein